MVQASYQERRAEFVLGPDTRPPTEPWCHVCQRPVRRAVWDHYADGFWGFFVQCHSDQMGCLVSSPTPNNECRLEVFCDTDSRVWWVNRDGLMVQDTAEYATMAEGPAVFGSRLAKWQRNNAYFVGLSLVILMNPIVLYGWWRWIHRLLARFQP